MPVSYDSFTVDPVQNVSISMQPEFAEGGKLKKYLFNISIKGKIVGPNAYINSEISAIIAAFKNTGTSTKKALTVIPQDGTQPFYCIPRIKSVTVDDGKWTDYCDFTIEAEADKLTYGSIEIPPNDEDGFDLDESWSVEVNEEDKRFTKVVHRLSCKAKTTEAKEGWAIAKSKIDGKINAFIPSNISSKTNGTFTNPHNKKTSYRISKSNGEVSAEITLTYHKPIGSITNAYATHDQTETLKQGSESARGITEISGNINGLAALGSTDRYGPASALFGAVKAAILSKYSTKTIVSQSESHDKAKGTINYSFEIEDYPKPSDGSKSRRLTIFEMGPLANPPHYYVIHQTIAGGGGPIFQDIGMDKVHSRTVTIELITTTDILPDTLQYKPANSIIDSDSVQKSLHVGKISRTTVFIWVP